LFEAGSWEWLAHDLIAEGLADDSIMSPNDWRSMSDIQMLIETLNLRQLNRIQDFKDSENA